MQRSFSVHSVLLRWSLARANEGDKALDEPCCCLFHLAIIVEIAILKKGHKKGIVRHKSEGAALERPRVTVLFCGCFWLRGQDLNLRPLGYEPNELPGCSTPQSDSNNRVGQRQTAQDGKMWKRLIHIHSGQHLWTGKLDLYFGDKFVRTPGLHVLPGRCNSQPFAATLCTSGGFLDSCATPAYVMCSVAMNMKSRYLSSRTAV